MFKRFEKFDNKVFDILNGKLKSKILTLFMYTITQFASGIAVASIPIILFFAGIAAGSRVLSLMSIHLGLAFVLNTFVVQILKRYFNRIRPYEVLDNINTYGIIMRDKSFPSGHAVSAYTIAFVTMYYFPRINAFIFMICTLIAISRIYLGVHYASDVVAGALLGSVLTLFTISIFSKLTFRILETILEIARYLV